MKINNFEEIYSWKKAKEITLLIHKIMISCSDYSFKDQIQRASISIMNNIAEGFERRGDKEFKNFLFIAKGSAAEVRSMTYIGRDFEYFNQDEYKLLNDLTFEISKLISGLIKTL
ncbi:MAG: S23 ribosomal protein [Candidatus Roizmanbacteria bacterium GW2011_GWA2_35_19]|uniref:S23 ribosomal protein n=2 Tax=Candidatus Roizmaniibacteriota TaxID=1752723 RepID=A0A0G0C6J1_9BACT|nr:MAG: S23 ribosomal protein [Candidatus Roizmanbacteria bacterium GW2011_GWC2_35_12]KKP71771.1 MAG: S23 ribosomal protein [Candidatus Roizmanbacteria bacterium GW2011_GWA2_35_19]